LLAVTFSKFARGFSINLHGPHQVAQKSTRTGVSLCTLVISGEQRSAQVQTRLKTEFVEAGRLCHLQNLALKFSFSNFADANGWRPADSSWLRGLSLCNAITNKGFVQAHAASEAESLRLTRPAVLLECSAAGCETRSLQQL